MSGIHRRSSVRLRMTRASSSSSKGSQKKRQLQDPEEPRKKGHKRHAVAVPITQPNEDAVNAVDSETTQALLSQIEKQMNTPKFASREMLQLDSLFLHPESIQPAHIVKPIAIRPKSAPSGGKASKNERGRRLYCDPLDIYEDTILTHWNELEQAFRPSANYFTTIQADVSAEHRVLLIEYLVEVCEDFKLGTQTMYLGVHYIDRLLSLRPVNKSVLQLVGSVALFVASKYEEKSPPLLDDFLQLLGGQYTSKDVLDTECVLLNVLRFRLSCPTPFSFIARLSYRFELNPTAGAMALFLSELFLHDMRYLMYVPSEIGMACILVALFLLDDNKTISLLQTPLFYDVCSLVIPDVSARLTGVIFLCAEDILNCYSHSERMANAIWLKYASSRFGCVSEQQFTITQQSDDPPFSMCAELTKLVNNELLAKAQQDQLSYRELVARREQEEKDKAELMTLPTVESTSCQQPQTAIPVYRPSNTTSSSSKSGLDMFKNQ